MQVLQSIVDFLTSPILTLVYLAILLISLGASFVVAKGPKKLVYFLLHDTPVAFSSLANQDAQGTYQYSYSQFKKRHMSVKSLFYLSLVLLLFKIAFLGFISSIFVQRI